MTHNKKGKFEYLTFKKLEKYSDKLIHFITLRHGGVSEGIYNSLNFRNISNDMKENVTRNIDIVCRNFSLNTHKIYKARQMHTDKILVINEKNKSKYEYKNMCREEYDGYIINEKGISNFITTADCNPIIIYDKNKNIVANVHAGWKGVTLKIYIKAIKKLIDEFSCNVNDLIVCIGPSIRKCCFSSEDKEFKKKFTDIWKNESDYIYYEENNKRFHIDLIYVIKQDLKENGILDENVVVSDICTCCNNEDFFSYRKSTQNNEKDYATFSTWVYLK